MSCGVGHDFTWTRGVVYGPLSRTFGLSAPVNENGLRSVASWKMIIYIKTSLSIRRREPSSAKSFYHLQSSIQIPQVKHPHLSLPRPSKKEKEQSSNLTHLQQIQTQNHVLRPCPRLPPPLPRLRQTHHPPPNDPKPLRPRRRPLHQPHPPANRQRQRPTLLDRQGRRHLLPHRRLPARDVDRTGG